MFSLTTNLAQNVDFIEKFGNNLKHPQNKLITWWQHNNNVFYSYSPPRFPMFTTHCNIVNLELTLYNVRVQWMELAFLENVVM